MKGNGMCGAKFGLVMVITVCLLSGCAAQVKYKFDKDLFVSSKPKSYSVVVDIFEDSRSEDEKKGKVYGKSDYAVSRDKMFKKNIPLQISNALAEHLRKAKVFDKIEVSDVAKDLEVKPEVMAELKSRGFDLAVVGSLDHFYGYYSDEVSAMTAAILFGLAGSIIEAVANPKTVGGNVEYGEVKIINLNEGTILWSGKVEHAFEKKEKFYKGPVLYVLDALKATNNKFSQKLANESF